MGVTAESLRGPLFFPIDLRSGLTQQPIRAQLMKGDKRANTIVVHLTEDKKPVDLTGAAVTGSFISPVEGAEIPLTGSVDGNEASVVLVDECYAEDGHFEANVKLTVGETSRTILSITGQVLSKGSGAVIDVGDVIPSIDDIIAQYQAMKQVTQETQAAGEAAREFAQNAPYIDAATNHWMVWSADAGEYVDTGVAATGPQGAAGTNGQTPYIGENGNWWTGTEDTGTKAQGPAGPAVGIDDSAPSSSTTYSSQKIEEELSELNEANAAVNLLKNSNFADPLNFNGYNTTSVINAYIVDDWIVWEGHFSIVDSGIRVDDSTGTPNLYQKFPLGFFDDAKSYTAAAWDTDGGVVLGFVGRASDHDMCSIHVSAGKTYTHAALYEGSYTADNVPHPRFYPKRLEMLNCGLPVQPRNLLHNSNFRNPVMQAGFGGFHGSLRYAVDRWKYNGNTDQLSLNDGAGISFAPGTVIFQVVAEANILDGNPYTLAIWTSDGKVHCLRLGVAYASVGDSGYTACNNGENIVYINNNSSSTLPIAHVALFEGAYTVEDVSSYIPKGYAAELAECQYYVNVVEAEAWGRLGFCKTTKDESATVWMPTTPPMRPGGVPSVTILEGTIESFSVEFNQLIATGMSGFGIQSGNNHNILINLSGSAAASVVEPLRNRTENKVKVLISRDL